MKGLRLLPSAGACVLLAGARPAHEQARYR